MRIPREADEDEVADELDTTRPREVDEVEVDGVEVDEVEARSREADEDEVADELDARLREVDEVEVDEVDARPREDDKVDDADELDTEAADDVEDEEVDRLSPFPLWSPCWRISDSAFFCVDLLVYRTRG